MSTKKTPPQSPKKKAKSHHKPKKIHHIYHDADQAVSNKIQELEKDSPATAGTLFRVMGLSFTDYAENRYLGADGVNDPWIQKSTGVDVPKNYTPHMSQEPINVNRAKNGMLK